ncbi:hypothetical protein LRB11_14040 [Ectothiorhodospira haloalkaliphila]|uniref:hypothetical protein n=1 Tax=Ectothiorhodospira haloalkaliphila TaxID=421628 RepID=UPI001EE7C9B7|nr:hypothetical protein [Ectothiorhodospira haloalkaliphila]MCG5526041.1 hypothetical protein [Ectothiorhodospira haloalkaliphila]
MTSVYNPCARRRPALLSRFDVDDISTDALLFQAGYLTLRDIHEEVPNRPLYKLGLPNQVEFSRERRQIVAFDVETI